MYVDSFSRNNGPTISGYDIYLARKRTLLKNRRLPLRENGGFNAYLERNTYPETLWLNSPYEAVTLIERDFVPVLVGCLG